MIRSIWLGVFIFGTGLIWPAFVFHGRADSYPGAGDGDYFNTSFWIAEGIWLVVLAAFGIRWLNKKAHS